MHFVIAPLHVFRECGSILPQHFTALQQENRNFLRIFSARLKWLRERLNLSQAELAVRAGVSESSIFNWEKGTSQPRNATVWERLARNLGVSVIFLQHGQACSPDDAAIEGAVINYGPVPENNEAVLREEPASYAPPRGVIFGKPATRADCEALVRHYLDIAERDPNGLAYAYKILHRYLRTDELTPSVAEDAESAIESPGIKGPLRELPPPPRDLAREEFDRRTRVNYPARPEVPSSGSGRRASAS